MRFFSTKFSIIAAFLFGSFLIFPHIVFSQSEDYTDSVDCITSVTENYSAKAEECIVKTNEQYTDDMANPEYVQALTSCSQGRVYEEYQNNLSECYEDSSFGRIWDLPVLKNALSNQFLDIDKITNEESQKLGTCLEELDNKYDLSAAPNAEVQQAISDCYEASGASGIADVYSKAAIVVDCAQENVEINGITDITTLMRNPKEEDYQYIEQCVIKRTAPVIAGLAILNIPFAGGLNMTFLFGQFILAQPLMFLRRRKYKTWGTVFNSISKNPLDLSSVRLIDTDTDKIVKSTVTGKNGNYLFLTQIGKYRLEAHKQGFVFPSIFGKKDSGNYTGSPIAIKSENSVVDKQIPLDPESGAPNAAKFRLKKWHRRLGRAVGIVAPFLSALALFFVRTWWTWGLLVLHVVLLLIFLRLTKKDKNKKFGKIYSDKNKMIGGAVVSLIKKPYDKRIAYTVTDIFGRYFLPVAAGEFTITVEKKGFSKKSIDVNFTSEQEKSGIINIDVLLK